MKKEIEYKTFIENPNKILNFLRQKSIIEKYKVIQKIYKSDNLSHFARIATFTSKEKKSAFLTIKKDLTKTDTGLQEGQIVQQDELESEILFDKTNFYNEVLIKLGLHLVQTRNIVKYKCEFDQTIVTIDYVQGKYHLEIEASSSNKINKARKMLDL